MLWSGPFATIPANWALCNGQTVSGFTLPDLRDRFVMGSGGSQPPLGGTATATLVEHYHNGTTTSSGKHYHDGVPKSC